MTAAFGARRLQRDSFQSSDEVNLARSTSFSRWASNTRRGGQNSERRQKIWRSQ
jgi:hypothetical protein